ncbi:hypothetical protein ColLi_13943 [Colletotrichum liriopes]|uniref:Uncharacterized protein n=1 Tax=Colletotrichum liriopes TaxID=708192 RepID=A0AA37LZ56_9PEZI|nr:hypothetical protein ColLi_13943 [Colletotrichum liriopes]
MESLPPAPSIRRSARSAARPGLKEAQRASYLAQFHIIELERFLNDQAIASKAARDNIHFHESIIVQLQGLAEKSDITKDNITELIETHRAKVSIAKKDLDVAALNESRARTQISMYTTSNPNIHANISASAAFRSVVDDLDVVVHALEESLPPPPPHARDNARLRSILAYKEKEIARLEKEIAELKVLSLDIVALIWTLVDMNRERRKGPKSI